MSDLYFYFLNVKRLLLIQASKSLDNSWLQALKALLPQTQVLQVLRDTTYAWVLASWVQHRAHCFGLASLPVTSYPRHLSVNFQGFWKTQDENPGGLKTNSTFNSVM